MSDLRARPVSEWTDAEVQRYFDMYKPHPGGKPMHPAVKQIMQYFKWDHLPEHLQEVSKPCGELAQAMAERFEEKPSPEVTVGLRKLLEAKDCFVRAKLAKED